MELPQELVLFSSTELQVTGQRGNGCKLTKGGVGYWEGIIPCEGGEALEWIF